MIERTGCAGPLSLRIAIQSTRCGEPGVTAISSWSRRAKPGALHQYTLDLLGGMVCCFGFGCRRVRAGDNLHRFAVDDVQLASRFAR